MGTNPEEVELTPHEQEVLEAMTTPEHKLSALLLDRTSLFIPPQVLRMLLKGRLFPLISKLAHEVHDGI